MKTMKLFWRKTEVKQKIEYEAVKSSVLAVEKSKICHANRNGSHPGT